MQFFTSSFTMKGNLTRDAVIRQSKNGFAINMGVAVQERVYDEPSKTWKDGETQFYDIVKWVANKDYYQKTALKGQPVVATGKIRKKVWEDLNTKEKRVSFEFVVDNLDFPPRPVKTEAPAPTPAAPEDNPDIPF